MSTTPEVMAAEERPKPLLERVSQDLLEENARRKSQDRLLADLMTAMRGDQRIDITWQDAAGNEHVEKDVRIETRTYFVGEDTEFQLKDVVSGQILVSAMGAFSGQSVALRPMKRWTLAKMGRWILEQMRTTGQWGMMG